MDGLTCLVTSNWPEKEMPLEMGKECFRTLTKCYGSLSLLPLGFRGQEKNKIEGA
jgi:hypothetical protein